MWVEDLEQRSPREFLTRNWIRRDDHVSKVEIFPPTETKQHEIQTHYVTYGTKGTSAMRSSR